MTVSTDAGTTLIDPGFLTFDDRYFDRSTIGEVQRVVVTHEHADHVKPEFVAWLVDRGTDVQVFGNQNVADLLAKDEIEVTTGSPDGAKFEDVLHGIVPNGAQPPNRSWTIDDLLTHPGDSHEPTESASILALPCIVPWGSMTASVAFAKRLAPRQVIPIHDFYLSELGKQFVSNMAAGVLAQADIEVVPLDWGEAYTA